MSNEVAISVENLGKKYVISHQQGESGQRYNRLSEKLAHAATAPFRALRKRSQVSALSSQVSKFSSKEDFWALKDVSFEVKQGEVLGIIGRNGAGKSTLLKILSRITEPTTGRIEINGRVASLLEVGTGFHPELTGRENIFLNGAILGMPRLEIRQKFEEIVAFAEVEKFLDTPVKRYSSGMYVRLAFAVAANLEPDILIVDEVLAVGDTEFQKKCMGKMENVAKGDGRTVIFVSHNMGAVAQLCSKALLLEAGGIKAQGPVAEVTRSYFDTGCGQWSEKRWEDWDKYIPGDETVKLRGVRVISENGQTCLQGVDVRNAIGIEFQYRVIRDGAILTPSMHLHNSEGVQIFLAIDLEPDWVQTPRAKATYSSTAWIPGNFLNTGIHYVSVALSRLDVHTLHVFERQVVAFNVLESSSDQTSRGIFAGTLPGAIRPLLQWETRFTGVTADEF